MKRVTQLKSKDILKVHEQKRIQNNSCSISQLMDRYLKPKVINSPRLTRKQEVFLKFNNLLKRELQNETVKNTMFKW